MIPDRAARLLSGSNIAHFATVMGDGSPQVTPVWTGVEDGLVSINTAEGRIKHRNLLRDPRVAVSVASPSDPLDAAAVRGRVERIVPDPEYRHADALSRQYTGRDYQYRRAGERRVAVYVRPERVFVMDA